MTFQPGDQVGVIYDGLVAGGPFTFVGQSPFDATAWMLRNQTTGNPLHLLKRNVFPWLDGLQAGDPVPIPLTRILNTKRTNQKIRDLLHRKMPTGPHEHPAVNLIRSQLGVPSHAPGTHNLGNEGRWRKVSASAGGGSSSAGGGSSSAGGGSSSAGNTTKHARRGKNKNNTRRRRFARRP